MNLTQLKAIVLIDFYQSISRAAVDLFISQASLSMSIKKLEEELGCAVIKRSSHGVSLTPKGKEILEHARTVCAAVDEIYRIGQRANSNCAVDASIGVASYLCNILATKTMLKMRALQNSQGIKINDISNNNNNIMEVYTGAFDLALLQIGRIEKTRIMPVVLDKYDISIDYLFSDKVCVVVSAEHPLAGRESCALEQLRGYPYITNKEPGEDAFYLYLVENGYQCDVIQANHVLNCEIGKETNGFWAGANMGVRAMKTDMKNSIHILKIDFCDFYYDIACITRKTGISDTARKFIELLEDEVQKLAERE